MKLLLRVSPTRDYLSYVIFAYVPRESLGRSFCNICKVRSRVFDLAPLFHTLSTALHCKLESRTPGYSFRVPAWWERVSFSWRSSTPSPPTIWWASWSTRCCTTRCCWPSYRPGLDSPVGWGDAPPPRGQQDLVVVLLLGVGAVQEQDVGVCLAAVGPHVVQKRCLGVLRLYSIVHSFCVVAETLKSTCRETNLVLPISQ